MENDYESNYLTPPNESELEPEDVVLVQEGEADIELIEEDDIIQLWQETDRIYLQKSSIENLIKLLKLYGNK